MKRTTWQSMEDRICLSYPNNEWFSAKMFIILVPSRICVMLPRLSYSFNMLLPFISTSDVQEFHWLTDNYCTEKYSVICLSVKSWKFTVQVNYWCLLNRFQYLVEVSGTALRNLQSKIRRDNKPALSLLGENC